MITTILLKINSKSQESLQTIQKLGGFTVTKSLIFIYEKKLCVKFFECHSDLICMRCSNESFHLHNIKGIADDADDAETKEQ